MRNLLLIAGFFISTLIQAQNWGQVGANIVDTDANVQGNRFGEFTAISGNGSVVAGSSRWQSAGGYVRAYEYSGTSWVQKGQTISGTKAFPDLDYIGHSVSLSGIGIRMSVGSSLFDSNSLTNNGKVTVYQYNSNTDKWDVFGNELFGLSNDELFGQASVLSEGGSVLAVGAPKGGTANGYVKVYNYSGSSSTWVQKGSTLQSSIANDGDGFGSALAMSNTGNVIAVGAPRGKTAGYVKVYEFVSNAWVQKGGDIDGTQAGEEFGTAVAMDGTGDRLIVGAPRFDNGSGVRNGKVKIFEWNANTSQWVQIGSDYIGFSNDSFEGTSVSMSDDGNTVSFANKWINSRIRVLEWDGSGFQSVGNDLGSSQTNSNFGISHHLNAAGDRIVIGVPFFDFIETDQGRVAVYDAPVTNVSPTDILLSSRFIDEDQPINSVIGTLTTIDNDAGDTHTYSISGADASSFSIDGSDLISAEIFDFETKSNYQITITTDDGKGGTFQKDFLISVLNRREVALNENFNSISNGNLPENWSGSATVNNSQVSLSSTLTLITPEIADLRRGSIVFRLQGGNSSARIKILSTDDQVIDEFNFTGFFAARTVNFNLVRDDISLPAGPLKIQFEAASGTVNIDDIIVEVPTPGAPIITNFDPYDVATAVYAGSSAQLSVDAQTTDQVNDIVFGDGGLKMFLIDEGLDAILEYSLTTPYDISSATYVGDEEQFSVASQSSTPRGLAFNPAGTKMFVGGASNVAEYNLSVAFDVSTATFAGESERLAVPLSFLNGLTFNHDGSRLFVVGDVEINPGELEAYVLMYTLTTPYDISTAQTAFTSLSVEAEGSFPFDINFDNSGNKMFIYEATSTLLINVYNLSTPFDLNSASFAGTDQQFLFPTDVEANVRGFTFNDDGRQLFLIGAAQEAVIPFDFIPVLNTDEENTNIITDIDANDGFGGENDAVTYTLQGADANLLTINAAGELSFSVEPDFENPTDADGDNQYDLEVRAGNEFGVRNQKIQILVNDIEENNDPTDIILSDTSVQENTELVATLTTIDPDEDDTHTYSVSGNLFEIRNDNELFVSSGLNFEATSSISVTITTDDGNGGVFSKFITITVLDVNEAPETVNIDQTGIFENQPVGTVVGVFSTVDPDANDVHTYSLSGSDAASFTIDGDTLKTAAVFDFETKNSYFIDVSSTDAGGVTFTAQFNIAVNDQEPENNQPTDILLSQEVVDENVELIATLSTEDPDEDDTHTYSVLGQTIFSITNGNELFVQGGLNFEEQDTYSVEINTTDNRGGSFTKTFIITVNDVNEAPLEIEVSDNAVEENQPVGTKVLDFTTADEDASDSHTYSISGTDAAAFQIEASSLLTAEVFDFETKNSYSLEVTSTDEGGLSVTRTVVVTIIDQEVENSIPTGINLSSTSIQENQSVGTLIGTLSTVDEDEDDIHVYSLSGVDAQFFELEDAELVSAAVFDFEEQSSYSIEVTSDDGRGGIFTAVFTIEIIDEDEAILSVQGEGSIYPNPATGKVFVGSGSNISKIQLINMNGQVILDIVKPETNEIDLHGIQQGTYLIQIETDSQISTQRIVIR